MVVARRLAKKLNDVELTAISSAMDKNIVINTDCIGIIFPVYVFGFAYCFAICGAIKKES
ncbi:MAG TPA: hypothetical protein PLH56_04385 [Candidatus Omnitrophota bacterium]|nr:hypothetical protein [Candidatus Omnitrophota bacterium]